jgi:predicted cation transporter
MVMIAGETVTPVDIGLFLIFLIVLTAPFKIKPVEKNLEAFLFLMGAAAVTITGKWMLEGTINKELITMAALEPIIKGIVPAVLVAGLIFFYGQKRFRAFMDGLVKKMNIGMIIFLSTLVLGVICSVITAIISSLFLCEIANTLPLSRKDKINYVVIACFAIGLGAVLTPLGEPLSTIAITKLQGAPYYAGFWYLFNQLGVLILLGVLGCSIVGMFYVGKKAEKVEVTQMGEESGGIREVFIRAAKVWLFVSALFLLGAGMEVIIYKYFTKIPDYILFWVNMVSAILDNATLTAAEISPSMSQQQINAALYGLLISGGMLIPGNIPNIISAGKLGITSGEWARLGVPFGLILNAIYFLVVFILGINPTLSIGM